MTTEEAAPTRRRMPSWLIGVIVTLAGTVVGFAVFSVVVYKEFTIPSGSMLPTLAIGSSVATDHSHDPGHGDIVVFKEPEWDSKVPSATYVKRVIAKSGQTVQGSADGTITVDGKALEEPYAKKDTTAFASVQVAPGQLWVMGDNRGDSADSRIHGPIPASDVVGVVRIHGSKRHVYGEMLARAAIGGLLLGVLAGFGSWTLRRRHRG